VALSGFYDLGQVDLGAYIERSPDEQVSDGLNFVLGLNASIGF